MQTEEEPLFEINHSFMHPDCSGPVNIVIKRIEGKMEIFIHDETNLAKILFDCKKFSGYYDGFSLPVKTIEEIEFLFECLATFRKDRIAEVIPGAGASNPKQVIPEHEKKFCYYLLRHFTSSEIAKECGKPYNAAYVRNYFRVKKREYTLPDSVAVAKYVLNIAI